MARTENQVRLPILVILVLLLMGEHNSVAWHMLLTSGVKLLSVHIANLRTTTLVNRRRMNQMYSVEEIETKLGSYAPYVSRYTQWFRK